MSRYASFNPLAERELDDAAAYYESNATGLGRGFIEALIVAVTELSEWPEAAPAVRKDIRRKVLRRFPYSLLYRVRGEEIRILAVMHQKRRPFYWVGRS